MDVHGEVEFVANDLWFLPVNLLALLMLLVCQSVQYKLSSNTVMAKGCGRPGESQRGPQILWPAQPGAQAGHLYKSPSAESYRAGTG